MCECIRSFMNQWVKPIHFLVQSQKGLLVICHKGLPVIGHKGSAYKTPFNKAVAIMSTCEFKFFIGSVEGCTLFHFSRPKAILIRSAGLRPATSGFSVDQAWMKFHILFDGCHTAGENVPSQMSPSDTYPYSTRIQLRIFSQIPC